MRAHGEGERAVALEGKAASHSSAPQEKWGHEGGYELVLEIWVPKAGWLHRPCATQKYSKGFRV